MKPQVDKIIKPDETELARADAIAAGDAEPKLSFLTRKTSGSVNALLGATVAVGSTFAMQPETVMAETRLSAEQIAEMDMAAKLAEARRLDLASQFGATELMPKLYDFYWHRDGDKVIYLGSIKDNKRLETYYGSIYYSLVGGKLDPFTLNGMEFYAEAVQDALKKNGIEPKQRIRTNKVEGDDLIGALILPLSKQLVDDMRGVDSDAVKKAVAQKKAAQEAASVPKEIKLIRAAGAKGYGNFSATHGEYAAVHQKTDSDEGIVMRMVMAYVGTRFNQVKNTKKINKRFQGRIQRSTMVIDGKVGIKIDFTMEDHEFMMKALSKLDPKVPVGIQGAQFAEVVKAKPLVEDPENKNKPQGVEEATGNPSLTKLIEVETIKSRKGRKQHYLLPYDYVDDSGVRRRFKFKSYEKDEAGDDTIWSVFEKIHAVYEAQHVRITSRTSRNTTETILISVSDRMIIEIDGEKVSNPLIPIKVKPKK